VLWRKIKQIKTEGNKRKENEKIEEKKNRK
jgi:hypothetical protein